MGRPVSEYSDESLERLSKQKGTGGEKARRELERRQPKMAEPAPAAGNEFAPVRAYSKRQAESLAKRLTKQGLPTEVYAHPSGDGSYAIRPVADAKGGSVSRETTSGSGEKADEPLFQSKKTDRTDWRRARDNTLSHLRQTYAKPVTVQAKNGDAIIVAFGGLKHALNLGIPTPEKTLVARHIQEIIHTSELASTVPDNNGRNDPESTSNYRTEASIDGEPYIVTTVVRNHSDGKRYYDHFAIEKAREGHSESDRESGSPARPTGGLTFSIGELGESFNTAQSNSRQDNKPDFQQSGSNSPASTPAELSEALGKRFGGKVVSTLEKLGLLKIHATVADARAAINRKPMAWFQTDDLPKVLTPSGYCLMSDIHVGDEVLAPDGSATRVEAVYPQGVKPIYRIVLSDGSFTRSTADHLWKVREDEGSRHAVVPLESIARGIEAGHRYEIPPPGSRASRPHHA
jgi:hypothetical protein